MPLMGRFWRSKYLMASKSFDGHKLNSVIEGNAVIKSKRNDFLIVSKVSALI